MTPLDRNLYADWRAQHLRDWLLHEGAEPPPEKLLQLVWFHQRLLRERLVTHDGQPVRVLHPGFWNREAGPDFQGAMVRIGGEAPRSGDIEVDLHSSGWRAHRHAGNPHFQNVLLHVVWATEAPIDLPTLPLRGSLDAPLDDLMLWLGGEEAAGFPPALTGQCSAPLRSLAAEKLETLIQQAALVRLQSKAAWLSAHARQSGWEQALWEGLFRALGYKQNVWPMQLLGELRHALQPAEEKLNALKLLARLLGVGGLMPAQLTGAQSGTDQYLRQLWDVWWREQERFAEFALPRAVWKFAGIRPGNHPQRRLALAAHWLAGGELPAKLERWCVASVTDARLADSMLEVLQAGASDDFWTRHWNLRGAPMAKPQPLLGVTRATDLAVNVILPWLWVRAREGGNVPLQREMERRFLAWPAAEDNVVLKLARQRLLGGARPGILRRAAGQQGLMQIVRDFCERSNAVCEQCRFPELVRQF